MFKIESQEHPSAGLNRGSEHLGLNAFTSHNPIITWDTEGRLLDRCV